jgi:DNA-binding transcriptional LysR family regulator
VQRVGTNPAVMFQLLPLALQHPDIAGSTMRYTICSGLTGTMTRALWDGVLDCYVGRIHWDEVPPQIAGALCHVPLMTTDLVVACARTHPLARKSRLRISDLAGWDWALPPGNSKNRIALEAGLRNNGLPHANATFEIAADPNALMILVREMELLTILPRLALDRAVAADLCALGLVDLRMPAMQIGFFTLAEHAQMPALQNLRQALAEAAQAVTSA